MIWRLSALTKPIEFYKSRISCRSDTFFQKHKHWNQSDYFKQLLFHQISWRVENVTVSHIFPVILRFNMNLIMYDKFQFFKKTPPGGAPITSKKLDVRKFDVQSTLSLVIRNGLIRNKLLLRNHLLHKGKEHLVL